MNKKDILILTAAAIFVGGIFTGVTYFVKRDVQELTCIGVFKDYPGPLDELAASPAEPGSQTYHGFPKWFYRDQALGGCVNRDTFLGMDPSLKSQFRPAALAIDYGIWTAFAAVIMTIAILLYRRNRS